MSNSTTGASAPMAEPTLHTLPTTALSRGVDRVALACGEFASALWTVLVAVIVVQVVARYAFGRGSIMMEEMQWHLYAAGFLLGISYTEVKEKHVRIDVLAETWRPRTRLWVELTGIAGLLLTFAGFVILNAAPFAATSYSLGEVSAAPGGLPFRWVLKGFLLAAFVLLALVGVGRLTRVWVALFGRP
jgi:TRAP-type mannitol/chloroaromatic compound transport system permease small subunit